jgi:hypothetical protein
MEVDFGFAGRRQMSLIIERGYWEGSDLPVDVCIDTSIMAQPIDL